MVTYNARFVMVIIHLVVMEKQMSRASRQKGQRGEREICNLLAERLGGEFKRNLMQTAEGGYDVLGLDDYAIEVKFQERLCLEKWWKQTVEQANGKKPVLIFRKRREERRVAIPYDAMTPCDRYYSVIPLDAFCNQLK